jgi:hypothetical protein
MRAMSGFRTRGSTIRGMVESLRALLKQVGGTPVVIPTDDYYAQALAKHRSELDDVAIPCVADRGTVELLVSQLEFSKWGAANAISSPRAARANDPDFALPLPLVAKPINKSDFRIIAQQSGKDAADFRFALLTTKEQFNFYKERHSCYLDHIVFQEFIPETRPTCILSGSTPIEAQRSWGFSSDASSAAILQCTAIPSLARTTGCPRRL